MESPFSIDGLSAQPVAHASPQSICIAPQGGPFSKQTDTSFYPAEVTSTAPRLWWLFKSRQRETTVLKPVLLWQNKQSLGERHGFYDGYPTPGGRLEQPRHTPGQSPPTPTRNSCSLVIVTRHRQNLHPMVRNNGSSFGRTTLTPGDSGKKTGSFLGATLDTAWEAVGKTKGTAWACENQRTCATDPFPVVAGTFFDQERLCTPAKSSEVFSSLATFGGSHIFGKHQEAIVRERPPPVDPILSRSTGIAADHA